MRYSYLLIGGLIMILQIFFLLSMKSIYSNLSEMKESIQKIETDQQKFHFDSKKKNQIFFQGIKQIEAEVKQEKKKEGKSENEISNRCILPTNEVVYQTKLRPQEFKTVELGSVKFKIGKHYECKKNQFFSFV